MRTFSLKLINERHLLKERYKLQSTMDTTNSLAVLFAIAIQVIIAMTPPGSNDQSIPCGNLTCSNNAKCRNNTLPYTCQCHAGFMGETCHEDRDECLTGYPCYQRGQCHNTIGSWWCECMDGWNGTDHCRENITESRLCMPGWTGEWCETCVDDEIACGYKEFCKNIKERDVCSCQPGYGRRPPCADVNECIGNPCRNSGSCINTEGSYICTCARGWTGSTCDVDINECVENKCKNGASCNNTIGSYSCTCTEGWEGDNCDTDINECESSNPCNASLVCVNSDRGYECMINTVKDDSGGANIGVVAGATTGALIALLTAVFALLYKFKWKRDPSSNKVSDVNDQDI